MQIKCNSQGENSYTTLQFIYVIYIRIYRPFTQECHFSLCQAHLLWQPGISTLKTVYSLILVKSMKTARPLHSLIFIFTSTVSEPDMVQPPELCRINDCGTNALWRFKEIKVWSHQPFHDQWKCFSVCSAKIFYCKFMRLRLSFQ